MSDNIVQNVSITGDGNIVVGKGNVTINPLPPAETRLRHDLGILLRNVQTTWIQGVLEKSIHEAALLELGMEVQEDAVDNPWRMVMESPDQSRQVIPRGRKIKDIFEEANHLLLILGEPGSGKTTTLLRLARELMADVDQAFTQPVPVILNLSTWVNRQQPLEEWLVAELSSKYRVPKKDGQAWLRDRRLLPLLDGLDEVRVENRAACVEKINQLAEEAGLQGLVVCSRTQAYTDLNTRLAFYRAIYIQPLTPEQVGEYLDQVREKLASLRNILQVDPALRSMAQSPLILNIMSLAYQNAPAEDLDNLALDTEITRRRHLFDIYISRMFHRKAGNHDYEDEHTKQRLSWLAQNMQRHNQDVFLIENLQPSWLNGPKWRTVYILASRSMAGLIIGLVAALSTALGIQLIMASPYLRGGGIATPREMVYNLVDSLINMMPGVLILGVILGLVGGLTIGVIDLFRFTRRNKKTAGKTTPIFWRATVNVLVVGLILMLSVGLFGGLLGALIFQALTEGVNFIDFQSVLFLTGLIGLLTGPMAGLIGGLIFGLRGMRQSLANDIQTVESLRWSWRQARKGIPIGLAAWLVVTLAASWLAGRLGSPHPFLEGSSLALCVGLLGPLFSGLHGTIVESKTHPNQGIRLSRQNAIFAGLIAGITSGLFISLFFGIIEVQKFGLTVGVIIGSISGLFIGLLAGLIVALWYGGLDIIQHYTLRLILTFQHRTPGNYARFLDYAADRIFIQKVGGGYRFIHRLLLEHFADMYKDVA